MRKVLLLAVVIGMIGVAAPAQDNAKQPPAQEPASQEKPLSAYKLQFVLRELQDGKLTNTRDYAVVMRENSRPFDVRIGSRIPVKNEKDFTYIDIGTDIRCWDLHSQSPLVAVNCTIEISNFALPEQRLQTGIATAPVLYQIRSDSGALMEEGKQTVISTIDDPNSTKSYEVVLTATKVK